MQKEFHLLIVDRNSHIRKAAFVPKQGSSSETLKDVILNILNESYIKKFKTPDDRKK